MCIPLQDSLACMGKAPSSRRAALTSLVRGRLLVAGGYVGDSKSPLPIDNAFEILLTAPKSQRALLGPRVVSSADIVQE